eukprot:SAG25_NODE_7687_length_466_cov_0.762943_1_plen_129_part_10
MRLCVTGGLGSQVLSPSARRIALAVASEIKVSGEGPAQVLHRDDEEWPLDLVRPQASLLVGSCTGTTFVGAFQVATKKPGAELELLSMWAASDFEVESGATCVCPGSHLWAAGREPTPAELPQRLTPSA